MWDREKVNDGVIDEDRVTVALALPDWEDVSVTVGDTL